MIDRRSLFAAGALLGMAGAARGVTLPAGFERFAIWPGPAPGGEHVTAVEQEIARSAASVQDDTAYVHLTRPSLTMLRPARPNGAALLLVPGGGYKRVAIGHEGYAIARRFAEAGFFCFVLLYRLPGDHWAAGPDVSLQDAQRAMRLIRARADRDGFHADRVGAIGFSAGGHLAARLATRPGLATYVAREPADALSARPDLAALLYPVISMADPLAHAGSRDELLGPHPSAAQIDAYSAQRTVTTDTPPTFLAQAVNDATVPVGNSVAMFEALHGAGVATELHLFETGGHGFGLTLPDGTPSPWPELFLTFAKRHGLV
jgi:acetyl esterase/lipase